MSTSEHEWRSNIGYILFPTLILTPRYGGTLFAYHDGNPVIIINRIFILLSSYLIIFLPFFKVWPLKNQDKDDFKPNLNFFPFLSRRNARATFSRYQPLFSKKIGCKTYLSLLGPFLCQTWLVQDKNSGTAISKINFWIFSKRIVNIFYKVLENVTIFIFSYFRASTLFSYTFLVFTWFI